METHDVTPAQYRASLVALGLNPGRVVSITLSKSWVSITQVSLSPEGVPIISLGQPLTHQLGGPLVLEEGAE